jgi:hypothetical protein
VADKLHYVTGSGQNLHKLELFFIAVPGPGAAAAEFSQTCGHQVSSYRIYITSGLCRGKTKNNFNATATTKVI